MTPEQKEHWRWTFAGQAMTHLHWPEALPYRLMAERSIHIADALIAELTKREQEECDHSVFIPLGSPYPNFTECPKCGKKCDVNCGVYP